MKKLIVVLLVSLILLFFCGCYNKVSDETEGKDGRIAIVYDNTLVKVYRDNETGVQYLARLDGGVCVMVDKDGNPYIG